MFSTKYYFNAFFGMQLNVVLELLYRATVCGNDLYSSAFHQYYTNFGIPIQLRILNTNHLIIDAAINFITQCNSPGVRELSASGPRWARSLFGFQWPPVARDSPA